MGILYFPIIFQFPMLFNWNSTFFSFFINFPYYSMGILYLLHFLSIFHAIWWKLLHIHTIRWESNIFPLFVSFLCYLTGILHFLIFLSIFHGVQWGLHIFSYFFIFYAIQWKLVFFSFHQYSMLFNGNHWNIQFFVNFPCFQFNGAMVLSNPIVQKPPCVLQGIVPFGAAAQKHRSSIPSGPLPCFLPQPLS